MMTERHAAVIYVDERDMVEMLTAYARPVGCSITVPVFPEIPEDAVLARVDYDGARRAFALVFEHPSFPVQPSGCFAVAIGSFERTTKMLAVL